MIDIAILRASGLTDEQILRVLETEQAERRSKVRDQNKNRQRQHRLRNAVTRDERDKRDERDPPPAYIPPPKEIKPKRVLSAKHVLPADFALSESDNRFAAARGWSARKIAAELERFRDHAKAHNRRQADWPAAWRNWVTSPYQRVNGNGGFHAANPDGKNVSDVAREMLAKIRDDEGGDPDGVLPPN